MEDVQALKPTMFCGVPRVFDRVYAGKARVLLCYSIVVCYALNLSFLYLCDYIVQ